MFRNAAIFWLAGGIIPQIAPSVHPRIGFRTLSGRPSTPTTNVGLDRSAPTETLRRRPRPGPLSLFRLFRPAIQVPARILCDTDGHYLLKTPATYVRMNLKTKDDFSRGEHCGFQGSPQDLGRTFGPACPLGVACVRAAREPAIIVHRTKRSWLSRALGGCAGRRSLRRVVPFCAYPRKGT